ncbi:MAG: TonB-dependent receptor [Candidatus Latescibacteria bacterium]|nr:TonB-dependent receptor [Candidatus Latescibacterota bacterium]
MRRHSVRTTLTTLLTSLCLSALAVAQERSNVSSDTTQYDLPLTIVTATRSEELLDHVASSVTVITRTELEHRQLRTVLDALRTVPGLDIVQSGSSGKATSAFLRGGGSSHTLVLIDGVEVNSPTDGAYNFGGLTTDNVERIEIVRGPQSALYGSDAIAGVIHIITRVGAGRPRFSLHAEGGRYGTMRGSSTLTGGHRRLGYSFAASRTDTDGQFANDDYTNTTLSGRLTVELATGLLTSLMVRGLRDELGVPGQRSISYDSTARLADRDLLLAYQLHHRVNPLWEHRLRISRTAQRIAYDAPVYTYASRTKTAVHAIDWQHDLTLAPFTRLTVGYEWQRLAGTITSTSPFGDTKIDRPITRQAFYAQDHLDILDRIQVTAGLRVDHHNTFGTHTSLRLTAGYDPVTDTRLKGSWGTGFRAPSMNELFFPGFGNPNLKPETSRSFDMGIERRLAGRRVEIGVTYFQMQFHDLIGFDANFVQSNINRASTKGVETTGAVRVVDRLTLAGQYTYLKAEDESTREPLLRRPKHRVGLNVDGHPTNSVRLHARLSLVGKRFDDSYDFSLPVPIRRRYYDGYSKLDIALSWAVTRHVELTWRAENALNRQYEEVAGYPAPAVTVLVGGRVNF